MGERAAGAGKQERREQWTEVKAVTGCVASRREWYWVERKSASQGTLRCHLSQGAPPSAATEEENRPGTTRKEVAIG